MKYDFKLVIDVLYLIYANKYDVFIIDWLMKINMPQMILIFKIKFSKLQLVNVVLKFTFKLHSPTEIYLKS